MDTITTILLNLSQIWEEGGVLMLPLMLLSLVLYYQIFDLLIKCLGIHKRASQDFLNTMENRLGMISKIVKVVPLVGLLGTVLGIITTFSVLGLDVVNQEKEIALGISEALITTQYGLIVTIPSMMLLAYLRRCYQGQLKTFKKKQLHEKIGLRLSELKDGLV